MIEEKKKEPIGTKEAVEKKVVGDLHKAANEDTGKEGTTARAAVWTLFLKTAVSDWFRHAAHGSQDHRVGIGSTNPPNPSSSCGDCGRWLRLAASSSLSCRLASARDTSKLCSATR